MNISQLTDRLKLTYRLLIANCQLSFRSRDCWTFSNTFPVRNNMDSIYSVRRYKHLLIKFLCNMYEKQAVRKFSSTKITSTIYQYLLVDTWYTPVAFLVCFGYIYTDYWFFHLIQRLRQPQWKFQLCTWF